ncbi:MAG: peptidoglycan-associated lipoprotein Pal [Sphingomonadaceae bacterium]
MTSTITKLMLATAVLGLAACAKKPPPQLPPPPPETTSTTDTTPAVPGNAPGSQADFVATVSSDRIYFETDSADVDPTDQATLQSQAQWLARYPNARVTIEGHADERGTREYNLALGERRANSTKNALAAIGVSADRITTISYGKERPEGLGSDDESWSRNRRAVTVTVQ